jgi:hypothetical protein
VQGASHDKSKKALAISQGFFTHYTILPSRARRSAARTFRVYALARL